MSFIGRSFDVNAFFTEYVKFCVCNCTVFHGHGKGTEQVIKPKIKFVTN